MRLRSSCTSIVCANVLVLSVILHTLPRFSTSQLILNPPESKAVFPNQSASFTCEVFGGYTSWRVNGSLINELTSEVLNDLDTSLANTEEGNALDILTIKARTEYNGTEIQCVTFGDFSDYSESVALTVQGLLSAVADLNALKNASSVKVSWTAPFSLDVTGVDPDIWYSVLIYKVTDENNPTAILCTDCINITETPYSFTPDDVGPCHTYNFTVIPFNGAGQGESSHNVSFTILDSCAKISINITRTDIIRADERNFFIRFHFSGEGERVCNYTLQGVTGADQLIQYGPLEDEVDISYLLPANKNYSVFFKVNFMYGTTILPNDSFTTYDIQRISAVVEGGGITVKGEFATDSQAKGCFVVLQGNTTTPDFYRALQRNKLDQNISVHISVPSSVYTLCAYDLEETAFPALMPAGTLENIEVFNSTFEPFKTPSVFITNATISQSGSEITIDCQFADSYPDASCVLVYREHGSLVLKAVEFDNLLPVTFTVHNPANYTFALFGRNGEVKFEEEPALCVKFRDTVKQTFPNEGTRSSLKTQIMIASIGAGAFGILSAILIAVAAKLCHLKISQANKTTAAATNAVYDYVSPPPPPSSSVPTKPNNAYATISFQRNTTRSIHTETNVAYAVSSL